MRIDEIEIRRFRSVEKLKFKTAAVTTLCGVNSCGKSNILRAIQFAFLREYDGSRMTDNITNVVEGGNVAVIVKLAFSAPTAEVAKVLSLPLAQPFIYEHGTYENDALRIRLVAIGREHNYDYDVR